MPPPSPKLDRWHYREWTKLSYLQNRDRYMAHVASRRVAHMKSRIAEHRPRLVLFYEASYRDWWEQIAGATLVPCAAPGTRVARNPDPVFMMVKQPVAVGASNADFDAARVLAADMLKWRL